MTASDFWLAKLQYMFKHFSSTHTPSESRALWGLTCLLLVMLAPTKRRHDISIDDCARKSLENVIARIVCLSSTIPVIIIMKLLKVTLDKVGHGRRYHYKSISVIWRKATHLISAIIKCVATMPRMYRGMWYLEEEAIGFMCNLTAPWRFGWSLGGGCCISRCLSLRNAGCLRSLWNWPASLSPSWRPLWIHFQMSTCFL